MIKFECHTETLAGELASFLTTQGFRRTVLGRAVLTDVPERYAGCFCCAMIRIGVPSPEDCLVELEG